MSPPHETSLTSLALLLAFAEEKQGDYLDYLTPFIFEAFNKGDGQGVNRFALSDMITSTVGLAIPSFVIELCLKRLCASKHLRYVRLFGGMYLPGRNYSFNSREFEEKRDASLANTRSVVSSLAAFASSEFQVSLTPQQAVDAILAYLSRYGIDCLSAYFDKSPIPKLKTDRRHIVIVNAFVTYAQESDTQLFERVVSFVEAQMLANALLCPDIGKNHNKLDALTLFFDTPLLLRILDLDDPDSCRAAQEVLNLCKSLGCRVAVFSHTSQETFSVMTACSSNLINPLQKGRLIREMRSRGMSAEELTLLAHNLDNSLNNLGIEVIKTPAYDAAYQVDEAILDTALDEDIGYLNVRARHYDINSIRAVYTLRSGTHPRWLEECGSVLVTTNSALARTAYVFGQKYESSQEVSTVISSFSLANILWLKRASITSRLPKLEVMAVSYAALQPSDALWEKVLRIERKMRAKADDERADHSWIRFSPRANRELMWLTLGDFDAITASTIPQLIQVAEAELVKHEREIREKEGAAYSETLAARDAALRSLSAGHNDLLYRLGLEQEKRDLQEARVTQISSDIAGVTKWLLFALCAVGYALCTIGLGSLFSAHWILWCGGIVGVVAAACSTLLGSGPLQWSNAAEFAIRQKLVKLLLPPDPEALQRERSILGLSVPQTPPLLPSSTDKDDEKQT